ncbi:hypothetical protein BGZ83_004855 [Gryganskiella cystojenkinii]|nr:hypothetical protein BGZ83_004855 [Gryganskiella cystojenkinii]
MPEDFLLPGSTVDADQDGGAFIPFLSLDLTMINEDVEAQLAGLEVFLEERNNLILKHANEQFREQATKFLEIAYQYLNNTLPDLLKTVESVSALMLVYGQSLEDFLEDADVTIQEVQKCINDVQLMSTQHEKTISDLSAHSMAISDSIKSSRADALSCSDDALKLTLISVGLTALSAPLIIAISPVAITGGIILGTAGGITSAMAMHDRKKSKSYTKAADKLTRVQDCNHEFMNPISNIYNELHRSKSLLSILKNKTARAAVPEATVRVREKSYKAAQEEAKKIQEVCLQFQKHILTIANLKGHIKHRTGQIREA